MDQWHIGAIDKSAVWGVSCTLDTWMILPSEFEKLKQPWVANQDRLGELFQI